MKKALLAVSFGTGCRDALARDIGAVEAALAAALPDRLFLRAFTSAFLRRKLAGEGLPVDDVDGALARLARMEVADVLIQPTLIAAGKEYEGLLHTVESWRPRFDRLAVGGVLLASGQDVRAAAEALARVNPAPAEGEAVVLLGHGRAGDEGAVYGALASALRALGWARVFPGAVEGAPGCGEVLDNLRETEGLRSVRLLPFLLSAGTHVRRDVAGSGPDSWRSRLEAAGYHVACSMEGLGQNPGIRALYAAHALAALK